MEDSSQNIGWLAAGSASAGLASPSQSIETRIANTLKSFIANGIGSAQVSMFDINTNASTLYDLQGSWQASGLELGVGVKGGIGVGLFGASITQVGSESISGDEFGIGVGIGLGPPVSGGAVQGFNMSSDHDAGQGFLGYAHYALAGLLKVIDALWAPWLSIFDVNVKQGSQGAHYSDVPPSQGYPQGRPVSYSTTSDLCTTSTTV